VSGKYPYGTTVTVTCEADHFNAQYTNSFTSQPCNSGVFADLLNYEGDASTGDCRKKCLKENFPDNLPANSNVQPAISPLVDLFHYQTLLYECVDEGNYPTMFVSGEPTTGYCYDGDFENSQIKCWKKCLAEDFFVSGVDTQPVITVNTFWDHQLTVVYVCADGSLAQNNPIRSCFDGDVTPPLEVPGSTAPTKPYC